jgi:hypothetical protein
MYKGRVSHFERICEFDLENILPVETKREEVSWIAGGGIRMDGEQTRVNKVLVWRSGNGKIPVDSPWVGLHRRRGSDTDVGILASANHRILVI